MIGLVNTAGFIITELYNFLIDTGADKTLEEMIKAAEAALLRHLDQPASSSDASSMSVRVYTIFMVCAAVFVTTCSRLLIVPR